MPSYTSNSDDSHSRNEPPANNGQRALRRFWQLLIGVLAMVAMLEVGTRAGFGHVSKLERRVGDEYADASRIARETGRQHLLLLGNSLLLEDVDLQVLHSELPKNIAIHRFAVESTGLYDWRYGVRRLVADGSRPDVVALVLGAPNFAPVAIRGEYSAYYLFRPRDIVEIGASLRYDRTQTADLMIAHFSLYYAGRNNIRNFVLGRAVPPYASVLHELAIGRGESVGQGHARGAMDEGLADVKRSCAEIGAKLVVVIAPSFDPDDARNVVSAGASEGVAVLEPVAEGGYTTNLYRDGFHLNSEGAHRFSAALAPGILQFARASFPGVGEGSTR
jgi:hypothetical protein